MANRIYITGGSGSGKSRLAREVASRTSLPMYDLDLVARVGGGNGPAREASERDAMVADILAAQRWIAEGIHVGWTDPLLAAAETIIWLDHVTWQKSSGRIVRRFFDGAVAESRRRGWRGLFRFRDYARHGRELIAGVLGSRRYQGGGAAEEESRAATQAALEPYMSKVVHCRTASDVTAAVAVVTAGPAA